MLQLIASAAAIGILNLTPMIKEGNVLKAQEMARVNLTDLPGLLSYAGHVEVNASSNAKTFFWYFPPLNGNKSAETLMWLQGGPGSSSLFGLFSEMGPITVDPTGQKAIPNYELTWARTYGMIFVDNPVGVGFSTSQPAGYATNRDDYMTTLYAFVNQFFLMFPDLQQNGFYVTGESYAGKYVPALAYRIHQENKAGTLPRIPLAGIILGDGLCDPGTMVQQYAPMTEAFSLVDWNEVKTVKSYADKIDQDIAQQQWADAFHQFDLLINGDLSGVTPYLANVTGFSDYFNALSPLYPSQPFEVYLNKPDVQAALHVNMTYTSYNRDVEVAIVNDVAQSMKDIFPTLLDNYRCLLYSGQWDVIVGAPLTIAFLRSINWDGQPEFESATRQIWSSRSPVVGTMGQIKGDNNVAGWATISRNLHYVIVRNAGHMVPADQPLWALDMVTRFIRRMPFDGPIPSDLPNPQPPSVAARLESLSAQYVSGRITEEEFVEAKKAVLM
eukprot:TRINITY_DN16342_c0_g1_i1.p1 TRINITY_DN16342_c0_g1~~TRINITY_DN16342_c0_g1_i1.p1  ORF type:complete len:514 (+),score=89.86 TRINITY_DN16342_c0_g1_i1:47-1543(+)